jgi:hypothetical protein
VAGPYILGTLHVHDLDEVRKYTDAGSFGIASKDSYALKIKGMDFANLLKHSS